MLNKLPIKTKKLHPDAKIPTYATEGSAGFDLYTVEDIVAKAHKTTVIPIGLAFEVPFGYEMQVRQRSGLTINTTLRVGNSPGCVDSDFRGEVKVIIDNTGNLDYNIEKGTRIAQGVLSKVPQAEFVVVDELNDTFRGSGGFGHSGTK